MTRSCKVVRTRHIQVFTPEKCGFHYLKKCGFPYWYIETDNAPLLQLDFLKKQ